MLGNPHVRFDERDVETGAMVGPLRHRQTKGAETDMPGLPPPRHIPTLPIRGDTLCTSIGEAVIKPNINEAFFVARVLPSDHREVLDRPPRRGTARRGRC